MWRKFLVSVSPGGQVESVEKLFCILSSDTMDVSLRGSAAEQLSVVLQGNMPGNVIWTNPCRFQDVHQFPFPFENLQLWHKCFFQLANELDFKIKILRGQRVRASIHNSWSWYKCCEGICMHSWRKCWFEPSDEPMGFCPQVCNFSAIQLWLVEMLMRLWSWAQYSSITWSFWSLRQKRHNGFN